VDSHQEDVSLSAIVQSGHLGAGCQVEPEATIALTGLFVHSLHTAILARDGKLIANLEGNEFTAQQFADLLESVLDPAQN
jgi:hypothetical protein